MSFKIWSTIVTDDLFDEFLFPLSLLILLCLMVTIHSQSIKDNKKKKSKRKKDKHSRQILKALGIVRLKECSQCPFIFGLVGNVFC